MCGLLTVRVLNADIFESIRNREIRDCHIRTHSDRRQQPDCSDQGNARCDDECLSWMRREAVIKKGISTYDNSL
jgi:hypothetical protein